MTTQGQTHYGISYAFAKLVEDTLPTWATVPVRVLTTNVSRPRDEREEVILVWVSQITNSNILSVGLPDALSTVEWECRLLFNDVDPSRLEQVSQYLTANLYNRWFKPSTQTTPEWNVVIRGTTLRENRLNQEVDRGFRWTARMRFRSEVYGALTSGLVVLVDANDPDLNPVEPVVTPPPSI